MPRIFISYRHADSKPYVGRLYDHLTARFDPGEVFRDIDSIRAGEDLLQAIGKAEGDCDVLIAVIGPHWLTVRDRQGRRRLADPHDNVRREIETALARGLRLVPALVGGAEMPRRSQLPASLAELAARKAIEISDDRFRHDVDRLVAAIGGAYGELRVTLGRSLALAATVGVTGLRAFEVRVDGTTVGRFGSARLDLSRGPHERARMWDPVVVRLREGLHTIAVTTCQLAGPATSSAPLLFRLKAGRTALFTVDEERPGFGGPPRPVIRPCRLVVEP
jgi:hypothetical protein